MDAKLILLVNGKPIRTIELRAEATSIGRAKGNQVQIPVANVSRRHCVVSQEGAWLKITDLGSSNGTLVNGEKVDEGLLKPGDVLVVGSATFRVEYTPPDEGGPAPVSAPPAAVDDLLTEPMVTESELAGTAPPGDSDAHQTIEISTVDEEIEAFPVDEVPDVEEDLGEELAEVEAIPLDSDDESGAAAIFADEDEEVEPISLDESEPIELDSDDKPTDVPAPAPGSGGKGPTKQVGESSPQDSSSGLHELAALAADDAGPSDGPDGLDALADLDGDADAGSSSDKALNDFLAGLAESDDDDK